MKKAIGFCFCLQLQTHLCSISGEHVKQHTWVIRKHVGTFFDHLELAVVSDEEFQLSIPTKDVEVLEKHDKGICVPTKQSKDTTGLWWGQCCFRNDEPDLNYANYTSKLV